MSGDFDGIHQLVQGLDLSRLARCFSKMETLYLSGGISLDKKPVVLGKAHLVAACNNF